MYVPGLDGNVGFLATVIPGEVAVADTNGTGVLVVDADRLGAGVARLPIRSEKLTVSVSDSTLVTVEVE